MDTVRPGLDPAWLARAAAQDPVTHAYASWDQAHEGERVQFLSYGDGREVRAYLVLWKGTPELPMVHYVGPTVGAEPLLDALPPRPLLAVVPPALAPEIRRRRGPIREYPVELRVLADDAPSPAEPPGVRRLGRADLPALQALRATAASPLLDGYREVDVQRTPVFGAFESGRLVAVAKASVTLSTVWMITGIVVDPRDRNRGLGRAVTAAATRAALAAGARPALHVRVDNAPARRIYDRLGYVVRTNTSWIDAGGNREP